MAYRIADLDAEAEYLLTREEAVDARAGFYRATGNIRDDAALPLPTPPGAVWVRRVTGVEPADPSTPIGTSERHFRLVFGDPASDYFVPLPDLRAVRTNDLGAVVVDAPAGVAVPNSLADLALVWPEPAGDVVSATVTVAPDLAVSYASGQDPRVWVGRWVARQPGYLATPLPARAEDWWRGSEWGRTFSVAFTPPRPASGPFSNPGQASDVVPFSQDGTAIDLVLVRKDHPYLPAQVLERQRGGSDVVIDGVARVPVKSRGLSFVHGPGHIPHRLAEGWEGQLYRHVDPSGLESVVQSVESAVRDLRDIVSRAGSNIVKAVTQGDIDALQSVAAAALAVAVAGPAGIALVGSDDPWRDAARLGALHYALWISPLTQAARGGDITQGRITGASDLVNPFAGSLSASQALESAPVSPGFTNLQAPTYQVAGNSVSADDIAAAEVWAQRLMIAKPEEANRILQKIVLEGGYVDLVFARLTIEAEKDAAKRAALLARVAAKQAEFNEKYLKYIVKVLGVIPGIGTALTIASILYQAAVALQGLEVALDAKRRAELAADRELAAIEAEIARLEAEIAALDAGSNPTQPGTALPPVPAPGASVDAWRAWWAYLLDRWTGRVPA